jgi:hypothetical protein
MKMLAFAVAGQSQKYPHRPLRTLKMGNWNFPQRPVAKNAFYIILCCSLPFQNVF